MDGGTRGGEWGGWWDERRWVGWMVGREEVGGVDEMYVGLMDGSSRTMNWNKWLQVLLGEVGAS